MIPLYLASASPRRLELLEQLGAVPRRVPVDVDERPLPGEPASELVRRLAAAKGRTAAARLSSETTGPAVVLAADTVVVVDGAVLGKPTDEADARRMLGRLSGRHHDVLTGVFLRRLDGGREVADTVASRVWFRPCSAELIRDYVATGEPLDKAGAYGIQGRGALLVERVLGSWWNVVGLPIERLADWLDALGIEPRSVVSWGDQDTNAEPAPSATPTPRSASRKRPRP
jgi:septum formation protein